MQVHFTRSALALVSKGAQGLVASAIGSIFAQPDEASARARLRRVVDGLGPRFPKAARLLEGAEADLLVHFTFPVAHRRQIRSTNPHERLNKEIRRRTDVVGIFPTRSSLLRLAGMLLAEQDDEWAVGRAYFSAESMAQIDPRSPMTHPSRSCSWRADPRNVVLRATRTLLHHLTGRGRGFVPANSASTRLAPGTRRPARQPDRRLRSVSACHRDRRSGPRRIGDEVLDRTGWLEGP